MRALSFQQIWSWRPQRKKLPSRIPEIHLPAFLLQGGGSQGPGLDGITYLWWFVAPASLASPPFQVLFAPQAQKKWEPPGLRQKTNHSLEGFLHSGFTTEVSEHPPIRATLNQKGLTSVWTKEPGMDQDHGSPLTCSAASSAAVPRPTVLLLGSAEPPLHR